MNNSETKNETLKVYGEVTDATNRLVEELRSENENNDVEVKKAVDGLIDNMAMKNKSFKDAVDELSKDSEFEKFTIAFFGQTNAGKSTIIEALRILFGEEGRQCKIAKNIEEKEQLEKAYDARCADVLRRIEALKKNYRGKSVWMRIAWPLAMFIVGFVAGAICMWRCM